MLTLERKAGSQTLPISLGERPGGVGTVDPTDTEQHHFSFKVDLWLAQIAYVNFHLSLILKVMNKRFYVGYFK